MKSDKTIDFSIDPIECGKCHRVCVPTKEEEERGIIVCPFCNGSINGSGVHVCGSLEIEVDI